MGLPEFILQNVDVIAAEWEAFAATLYPSRQQMSSLSLRDHVKEIMEAVAADIRSAQTKAQQADKSRGLAPKTLNAPETAAQTHAVLRAKSGLDISQLASEYRALRACVLRLWEESGEGGSDRFQDMIRFNEAIDQALAESIEFFAAKVDESRNLLVGALGHDMRSPLQAILLTARNLKSFNAGIDVSGAAACLIRSGASIQALLNDLLDFSITNLGQGIRVDLSECDLGKLFAEEVEQQRAAHPEAVIELEVEKECKGKWDGRRLQQVLRNLLTNAIAYGSRGSSVAVRLFGDASNCTFCVTNQGRAIDPAVQARLFDPLKRGVCDDDHGSDKHLGIGLYIVREIAVAHGGEVNVQSARGETVFTVRLPG